MPRVTGTAWLVVAAILILVGPTIPSGAAVPRAVVPEAAWRPCPGASPLGCTDLVVPLDHENPSGDAIRLPVRRLPALDPSARIGVLVVIAGGPGQRGTELVDARRYDRATREAFDIVSWDPRGTSGDTLIDCIPEWDPFLDLDRTPDTPSERAAIEARTMELADHCQARHARLLPFIGTLQAALDLERLRRLLGEATISLFGTSYGSKVAVVYATLFPEHVRAVLVDGYADANQTPAERDLEQATTFERELEDLLDACTHDAGCPFAADADPTAAADMLLQDLDTAPMAIGGGRVLRQADAYEAITAALVRGPGERTRLLRALAAATAGEGSALLAIAEESRRAFTTSGLTLGTFAAISCADDAAFWRSQEPARITAHVERMHAAASTLGAWLVPQPPRQRPLGLCAMQPDATGLPHAGWDARGAGPVLVLATSGDPTTPLSAARRGLVDLDDASLVEVTADHHTAYGFALADPSLPSSRCLLEAVQRFLIELARPRPGIVCA